ncbi:IS5 family transposase [Streptomyces collinus]|uniref:IS5 family transposase n=1 Tax=Streptomyces collinus TaxID=42684 RepID=UPI003821E02C
MQLRLDQSVVGPGVPLTDAQWARIEPLLPERTPKRGGRWRDHREVIDAIAFTFQAGTQWVNLPEKCGHWRGVYNRLRMWAVDVTWERVFTALITQADADENLAGPYPLTPRLCELTSTRPGPAKRASWRTGRPRHRPVRGGLTTKIHLAADARCRPLAFVLTAGQAGDAPAFTDVRARLRVPRRRGRARTRSASSPCGPSASSSASRRIGCGRQ